MSGGIFAIAELVLGSIDPLSAPNFLPQDFHIHFGPLPPCPYMSLPSSVHMNAPLKNELFQCKLCHVKFTERANNEHACQHHHGDEVEGHWTCCNAAGEGCCQGFHLAINPAISPNLSKTKAHLLPASSWSLSHKGDVEKDGFMSKRGHFVKSWKVRFFKMRGGTVHYYKEPHGTEAALGVIDLRDSKLSIVYQDDLEPMLLLCDVHNSKDYLMYGETSKETEEWLRALLMATYNLKRPHHVASFYVSDSPGKHTGEANHQYLHPSQHTASADSSSLRESSDDISSPLLS